MPICEATGAAGAAREPLACFSIDVEEYYHAEVFARAVPPSQRAHLPRRAARPLEQLLDLLAMHGSRATLFVLADCVGDLAPLLRRAIDEGHEIASHGYDHAHLRNYSPETFRADLRRARALIEDTLGVTPRGYRAPTFSITRHTWWALDVLVEEGYRYDSSIFPIVHDRYGVPTAPRTPFHAVAPCGARLVEFPPLTTEVLRLRLPVGGGGYLRLLPAWLVSACVRRTIAHGDPVMIYLHPWELDPNQPRLPASALATLRHRLNLARTAGKVGHLLRHTRFDTAARVLAAAQSRGVLPEFSPTWQTNAAGASVPATSETK